MIDLHVLSYLGASALFVWWGGSEGTLKAAGPSMAEIEFAIIKRFQSNVSAINAF